jgi:protein-S-isoprenylcysteine O-methyltransferase Ste14
MERTVSKIGFIIAVLGLVILIQKEYVFSTNPVTIFIQIFSVALMIWSRFTLGFRSFHVAANPTKGELVTSGPYRFLRHPIYAAVIYFSWACFFSFPFPVTLVVVFLITGGLFVRMIMEEKSLLATYPEYDSYRKRAKRLIPFLF